MDTFDANKYINGKKKFWVFTILMIVQSIMACFLGGAVILVESLPEVLFLFLLYRGYIWVWYFDVIRAVVALFLALRMIVISVPRFNALMHAYSPLFIIYIILGIIVTVAINIVLLAKNELRYFAKVNQLSRKGLLDNKIQIEVNAYK